MVLYLDPYFLGDPLFLAGFARDVAARPTGLVVVHGSGERGERALEALGRLPEAEDGVWDTRDDEGRSVVERATRDLNREITHELNEAGVATVGALGADRGLLKQVDGEIVTGRTSWVGDLVRQRVTVVVASLVDAGGDVVEVDAARAAGRLAAALGEPLVALTTRSVAAEEDLAAALPDAPAVLRAAGDGEVWVGPRPGLRVGGLASLRNLKG